MAINRFNDGDVLYAAPLNQMVDEINNNTEESASIKANLTELNSKIVARYNFADNDNVDIDYYWANIGGNLSIRPSQNYRAFPRIFLQSGKTYTMTIPPTGLCYVGNENNKYKALLSSIANGNKLTPTEDCYAFISFARSETDYMTFMLVEGDDLPIDFKPFGEPFSVKYDGGELLNERPLTFYVKQNGGDFTRLKDAIEFATRFNNAIIYVERNTYDLVDEFGSDYLDNAPSSEKGLVLKNGVHIICESGTKILFHYEGDNSQILINFSPLNSGVNGFTLENAIIEASRCRYCVHDERGNSTDGYVNKYVNCEMSIDNTNNPRWTNPQVIGCGLCNGTVMIDKCHFHNWITFHTNNGTSTTSKGKAIVTDCFFDVGGVMAGSSGVSTEKTELYVSNINGKQSGGVVRNLDISTPPTVVNLEIIEWNNHNRSSS